MDELVCQLLDLERTRFTGWFRALAGKEAAGVGLMAGGRLGWTVARRHWNAVADLLVRLGGIELRAVEDVRLSPKRHLLLPTALLEAQLVSLAVLRRAVLLHVRGAVASLRAVHGIKLHLMPVAVRAAPELLYSLGEIMPDVNPEPVAFEGTQSAEALLAPLFEVSGFLAAVLLDAEGRALAGRTRSAAIDARSLASLVASAAEAATRLTSLQNIGRPAFLLVGAEGGSLLARWVECQTPMLVAVLVADEASIGMAKHRLNAIAPAVTAWVAGRGSGA